MALVITGETCNADTLQIPVIATNIDGVIVLLMLTPQIMDNVHFV